MPVSEIPALSTEKKGVLGPAYAHGRCRREPLVGGGGSGGMLLQDKFTICASKMPFPAF